MPPITNADRISGEVHRKGSQSFAIDIRPAAKGHDQNLEDQPCSPVRQEDVKSWYKWSIDQLGVRRHSYLKLEDPSHSHPAAAGKWDMILTYLLWTLATLTAFLFTLLLGFLISRHTLSYAASSSISGAASALGQSNVEPITLIAMWLGAEDRPARTFPIWLSSLAAQDVPIELIWLNMYTGDTPECLDISAYAQVESNLSIKQECVHIDHYYNFMFDLLCTHWKCSTDDRTAVKQHLEVIKAADNNLVNLHPFVGHYMRSHISGSWWAWLDSDMALGDFSRMFPYAIMHDFDIITFGSPVRESIYLHGQFTAFRTQALQDNLFLAPGYSSPQEFVEKVKPDHNADERYWSEALMKNDRLKTNINWLQLKGRQNDFEDDLEIAYYRGRTVSVPSEINRRDVERILDDEESGWPTYSHTFTVNGETRSAEISENGHSQCAKWDPVQLCPVMSESLAKNNRIYLMRKQGQYSMRVEPLSTSRVADWQQEFLLAHWQCAKEWMQFPTSSEIGGYDDVVWTFNSLKFIAWRKGHPDEILFEQSKPSKPPTVDRTGFAWCPW